MRLLVATGIFHPEPGGPATYLYHILPALQARGHAVSVLTFSDTVAPAGDYPYPVARVARGAYLQRQRAYYRSAQQLWPGHDLAFVHSLNVPLPAQIRPRVGKIVGDPAWERAVNRGWAAPSTDVDAFQATRYGLQVEANKWQRAHAARSLDHVIVPSDYLRRMVIGWGVRPERVTVIYNALHEQTASAVETQGEARRKLHLPDAPLILTVARITAWKGIEQTLHALARLRELHLVVAGNGPMREAYEALAHDLGLAARVRFLGSVPRSVMPLMYRAADYTLLYSGYEGLSHVLLESLSAGTPVIASSKGGNPEVVQHDLNGLLVAYPDVEALAEALMQAFTPGTRERLAAHTQIGLERFGWQHMVERTAQLLESFAV